MDDDLRSRLPGGSVPYELLPAAADSGPCCMEIIGGHLGPVRVTLEPWSYMSHRSRNWSWRVVGVEAVPATVPMRDASPGIASPQVSA